MKCTIIPGSQQEIVAKTKVNNYQGNGMCNFNCKQAIFTIISNNYAMMSRLKNSPKVNKLFSHESKRRRQMSHELVL
jgi:hypothetical protein